jgi:hypothetical protein
MTIQKATADRRIQTGPVQFDQDFPGYFIRGEDIAVQQMLRLLSNILSRGTRVNKDDWSHAVEHVNAILEDLCRVQKAA